jgi:hypothetical protein
MKYFRSWSSYLSPGRSPATGKLPWITFSAIDRLNRIINPDMEVFEYGSGGSTLFWASRVRHITSVEHDREWFEKMQGELQGSNKSNIRYLLIEPQPDADYQKKDYRVPEDYISSGGNYRGKNFENYVKAIDMYPDRHFDVIVIDGRARPSCILHSLPKLKKGGWLLIDNADRSYYLAPFPFKRPDWKIHTFDGPVPFMKGFSRTSLLQKCY